MAIRRVFFQLLPLAAVVLGVSFLFASQPDVGFADPGQAGLERLTLEQLTLRADRVVVGTVADVSSLWIGDQIYTDATISVDQTAKGSPADEVVVRQLGGEVGDIGLNVSNMPVFAPSERVVLFIRLRQDSTYEVVGLVQGKFVVEDDHVYADGERVPLHQFLQQVSTAAQSGGQSADSEAPPQEVAPEEPAEKESQRIDVQVASEPPPTVRRPLAIKGHVSRDDQGRGPLAEPGQVTRREDTFRLSEPTEAAPPLTEPPEYEQGEVITEGTLQALAEPPEYEQAELISTIKSEGFEGAWPGEWALSGNPTWGDVPCETSSGSWSGWQSDYGSGNYYPCYTNNANAWMKWPYDGFWLNLGGASFGGVSFYQDLDTQLNHDTCGVYASLDGLNYYGSVWTGDSGGYAYRSVSFANWPGLGDIRGYLIKIAFIFQSDGLIVDRGCFLDDIDISVNGVTAEFVGFGAGWSSEWDLTGSPTWGDVACNPHSGARSGWQSATVYGPCYPDYSDSRMKYGPFDLSNALNGGVEFDQWLQTELSQDWCGVYASIDGSNYYPGSVWSGSTGGAYAYRSNSFASWPGLGNLLGQPQVWLMFRLDSDSSVRGLGCFLDEIRIWKDMPCYLEMIANPPQGGTTDPEPGIWFAACGTQVPIEAFPTISPPWQFDGWSGSPDCTDGWVTLDGYDTCIANFSPLPIACEIGSFNPLQASAGTGTTVNINGLNFGPSPGGSVTFYGGPRGPIAAPVLSWSNTQVVVEVPKYASSGPVTVTPTQGPPCEREFPVTFGYLQWKWPGPDPMGERILINANTPDTGGEWLAVWEGAQTWNDVDGADFYFDYGGRTAGTGLLNDGVNQVFWTSSDPDVPPEALAVTGCWYTPATGLISDCDMAFNDNYTWDTSGSPGPSEHDVQSIAAHEFGHFLACSDLYGAADSGKIMFGYGDSGTINRNLDQADIDCISWIYPGAGTRGQYVVQITNNDDDSYPCVDFKSDLDAVYDRCAANVTSGGTTSSFETPVTAGPRTICIRWADPDIGIPSERCVGINVPLEGVATVILEITPDSSCGPEDTDGDGFSDEIECYVGTDPNNACGTDCWPPDFNSDHEVDVFDILMLAGHFNCDEGQPCYDQRYDLNADGRIDIFDILIWAGYFKQTCAP